MAEVLGTVVGVVSLGLQVCSGLNVYIDGLQCRKEEIESTIRHQKSLETLIAQIEGLHDRHQASGICSAPLQESMASAKAELLLLDEFISKICIEGGSGTDRSAANMMKIQKKRLLYPFRRDRLDRLVTRLDVVIKALQTALQVFELEASIEMKISFEQVLQTVSRSESTILAIERKIDNNASLAHLPDYTTKQDMMELKQLITDLISSSAAGTLKNIVSKPSALKVICDNMTNPETTSRTDGSSLASSETVTTESVGQETKIWSQFHCTCNPHRILRRQKRSLGPVSFAKEAVTKRAHVIGCPFAVFDIHETNSWSAGITVRAFRGLVSTAVNVSLSITTGAGGFGMSPSFTCFQMRENSPAFQVVDILLSAFSGERYKLTDEGLTEIFERGIHTLKTVFTSRTSSPFDIDISGGTLLHAASSSRRESWINHRHELIEFLLTVGVPRDHPNQNDEFAFQNAQTDWYIWRADDLRAVQTLDALRPYDGAFSSGSLWCPMSQGIGKSEIMRFHQTWIKSSITAAEVYFGHPLEAVLFRDKSRLLEVLDKQVSLNLSKADAFGFSSLFHLIGWPEGLKIVLSRYGKLILHSHDKARVSPALECALEWGVAICCGPRDGRCLESCPCGEAVSILLQTDSECLARATRSEAWFYAIAVASARARNMVIDELANRRQELKALALRHLKPTEIDRFGLLGNNILDIHTGNVLKALDDKGICVHPSLSTEVVDTDSSTSKSVYHNSWMRYNGTCRMPNAFYSRGFTEVDVPNSHGLVPLAMRGNPVHYREWLVDHGANLTTEIPGRPVGFTTAHMSFSPWDVTVLSPPSLKDISGSLKSLRNHVSKSVSLDTCKCGCSKDGCHPYAVMWRAALGDWSADQITLALLKQTGDEIIRLCKALETEWILSQDEISICLRGCTFMALPIRHTCCGSWEHKKRMYVSGESYFEWVFRVCEEDEVEEIQEEDANELTLLESLLVEFESKIDEMGCTLATFFETYWIDRMGQVLQEIQDRLLLEEEVQGAERLGISLRVEEEENEQEDESQLEYWFRKLDAVVA